MYLLIIHETALPLPEVDSKPTYSILGNTVQLYLSVSAYPPTRYYVPIQMFVQRLNLQMQKLKIIGGFKFNNLLKIY